jgi:hypothetical protein
VSSAARYQALLDEIRAEFPRFRIVDKADSRLHRAIDRFLKVVTFGGMRSYLDSFQTTVGSTVYVTPDWHTRSDDERYVTMRHEREHLRQFRRFGLPLMGLLYVAFPLPVGLAWFRAHWEKEGYAESIRAAAEVYGLAHVEGQAYRRYVIEQFVGPHYGWMWPFPGHMARWYDAVLAGIRREREGS